MLPLEQFVASLSEDISKGFSALPNSNASAILQALLDLTKQKASGMRAGYATSGVIC